MNNISNLNVSAAERLDLYEAALCVQACEDEKLSDVQRERERAKAVDLIKKARDRIGFYIKHVWDIDRSKIKPIEKRLVALEARAGSGMPAAEWKDELNSIIEDLEGIKEQETRRSE